MANSTAPATNTSEKAEDPNRKDPKVVDAADEPKEGDAKDEKEPTAIETAACDAWSDVTDCVSWAVGKAKDAATGLAALVVPDLWSTTPEVPAATQAAAKEEAVKPPEKQEKSWFGKTVDWVKGGVEKVADAVSGAWNSVFGEGAKYEEIKTADGSKKGFTVTQTDGDVITATRDNTVIKRPDGTTVTRDRGVTTVEKDGVTITRDRNGRETFKLKDGTTGVVDGKNLTAELKGLHETVNDKGVTGDLKTARGARLDYFKAGHRRMRDLTPDEKDHDVVETEDATRIALDRGKGIFAERSTNPNEKTAIIKKEGSDEAVEVKQVDGRVVARYVKLDKDGKPVPGSETNVSAHELPAWFREHIARKNNGVTPETAQEMLRVAGVQAKGTDEITVTGNKEQQLGPCESDRDRAEGKTVSVTVPGQDGKPFVFMNGGGVQKTVDTANNQSSVFDGDKYHALNGDKPLIDFDVHDRHLELFDERGNKIVDSTHQGTSFADGDYIGANGSYTDGKTGRTYFSQQAQEMQAATNQSIVALNTAAGQINSFRGNLGKPGLVDVGELSSSMASLTQALALCIKSGNFTHLASILSTMGLCQDLIAQGVKHNADVSVVKAAVHDARDSELDATRNAPNDVAVETLRRSRMTA